MPRVLLVSPGFHGYHAAIGAALAARGRTDGGVVGVLLMLGRRATRKSRIPFGPFMIAGAWIGVFAGDAIARVYLTSTGIT